MIIFNKLMVTHFFTVTGYKCSCNNGKPASAVPPKGDARDEYMDEYMESRRQ